MEFEKTAANPNPWTKASFISRIFFWWLLPFFRKGNKGLTVEDIYDCPDVDSSQRMGDILQKEWEKELQRYKAGKKPSLLNATVRAFGGLYALNGILVLIEECFIHVLQPILLGYLIESFASMKSKRTVDRYLYAAGVCLLAAMFVFTHHPYFFTALRFGMRLRVACCNLVYRKALRLSHAALGKTTVGQMVNLLSNDVNRFDQSVLFIPYFIAGPLQTAIIIGFLWQHISYACLAGVSILMLYIPFQGFMGKLFSKLRIKTAVLTDERIRLMNEIISGMRVIKMYTWEYPFAKLVDLIRRKEVKMIRRTAILRGVNIALFYVSSKVILFISFIVLVLAVHDDLTPTRVFVSMSLFNSLRVSMTLFFPNAIAQGAESIISLKRLQKFLMLEEQEESQFLNLSNLRPKLSQCGIWMEKVVASWSKDSSELTLENITLTIRPGELLAIVGPVGCGKTSLLMSILGELPIISGNIRVAGKISYASQEPWAFSGNVKQNVIFGSPYDEQKYKTVLNVCALDKDIEQFPYGDRTLVGERGVSLSGGQKARVNLARAMYFDADIFLLDDPLSAVDAAVSKHLFEKCINGYLKDKIRILCTHQIQFLRGASQILVLKEGRCMAIGTYQSLVSSGIDFGSLMEEYDEERRQRLASFASTTSAVSAEDTTLDTLMPLYESSLSVNSVQSDEDQMQNELVVNDKVPKVAEETKSSGSIKLKVYNEYLVAGTGPFLRILLIVTYVGTQVLFNGCDYWLTKWTGEEQLLYYVQTCYRKYNESNKVYKTCIEVTSNYTIPQQEFSVPLKFNIIIYTVLVWSVFLLSLVRTSAFFTMCMQASINLHNKMFRSVLRAPISFFDNNPVGRVLNRFSKDSGIIDETLPLAGLDTSIIFFGNLGIIAVVATVEPWLLLPTFGIGVVFVFLRNFYIPTARDVKRFEGITKSPVFSHLSTSLYGLTTIRAFKVQGKFEDAFDHYQDKHTSTWFMFMAVTRWFGIYLDWLCVFYISSVTIAMVILSKDPSYAAKAGLAIASALQLSGSFQWGVRQSAEVESQMTSVERVVEYSNLKPEADLDSKPGKKPPPEWPQKGNIIFHDVSLQYCKDDPPVLKNLSFKIFSEEKIGIVGRTGAGKSSMISLLFRMTEPHGIVELDGVRTNEIGLHDLRKKISIIPQDPVLFNGPVRRNLDPFNEHTDKELWQALDEAYLKEAIQDLSGGLDTEVSEGGSNFSVGQRQLICLARAILRRNRILVLDEATANVDPNTDSLIQQTIRSQFRHCTVLTIAHRLHTIMDSDRVLVLDAGEIMEFDEPYVLLQNRNSQFSHMVQMTGPSMAQQLREVARQAHVNSSKRSRYSSVCQTPNNVFGSGKGDEVVDMNNSTTAEMQTSQDMNGISLIVPSQNNKMMCTSDVYEQTEMTYL